MAAKKDKRKHKPQWKVALGYSPAQETASGAGYHEPPRKKKRQAERRDVKRQLRSGDYE